MRLFPCNVELPEGLERDIAPDRSGRVLHSGPLNRSMYMVSGLLNRIEVHLEAREEQS